MLVEIKKRIRVGGGKSDFFIWRCPLKRSRRKEEEMAGLFEEGEH